MALILWIGNVSVRIQDIVQNKIAKDTTLMIEKHAINVLMAFS